MRVPQKRVVGQRIPLFTRAADRLTGASFTHNHKSALDKHVRRHLTALGQCPLVTCAFFDKWPVAGLKYSLQTINSSMVSESCCQTVSGVEACTMRPDNNLSCFAVKCYQNIESSKVVCVCNALLNEKRAFLGIVDGLPVCFLFLLKHASCK